MISKYFSMIFLYVYMIFLYFISTFFTRNLNTFDKIFRRSNLLTEIDALDPAILSSRCETKVQIRMSPVIGINNTEVLAFPMKIATPDDINHIVESSVFTFEDKVCQIKNILSGTTLQIIDVDGNVLLDIKVNNDSAVAVEGSDEPGIKTNEILTIHIYIYYLSKLSLNH